MRCHPLIEGNIWRSVCNDFGRVAGTYCLRVWRETPTDFTPFPRLLGIDHEGTLYIGTSSDLPNRIGSLKKAVCAAYGGLEGYRDPAVHGAGRMIGKLFVANIAHARLCVEVHTHPLMEGNAFDHHAEEWRLLSAYAERFGEFPPLNGLKPSRVAKDAT